MSTQASGTRSPPSSLSAVLQRGHACITCRRKKMRCDGARPYCGQCCQTRNPEHCEYTDKQGRTQTEILEERLNQLRLRIQELENPINRSSPIYLHYPYGNVNTAGQEGASSRTTSTGIGAGGHLRRNPSATGQTLANTAQQAPSTTTTSSSTRSSVGNEIALPFLSDEIFPTLLEIFISHSSRLGFSFHIPRFRKRIAVSTQTTLNRPHDALLATIALWAICISRNNWTGPGVAEVEQFILAHTLHAVPTALAAASASPGAGCLSERIDFIQAEVLLALYFFCQGRLLEGRYHASAAMSSVVIWKMHVCPLRTLSGQPPEYNVSSMAGLSPTTSSNMEALPRDAIELGERINLFWSAYVLDRCWSVALDSPSVLAYDNGEPGRGTSITTQLPRSLEWYEKETLHAITNSTEKRHLRHFLSEQADFTVLTVSHLPALRVIAATLFGNATSMVGKQAEAPTADNDLISRAASLEKIIVRFTDRLTDISTDLESQTGVNDLVTKKRELSTTRSVALAAMVQVHNRFVSDNGGSVTTPSVGQKHKTQSEANISKRSTAMCLRAAQKIATLVDDFTLEDVEYLDSIIGVAWLTASRILSRELRNMQPISAEQGARSGGVSTGTGKTAVTGHSRKETSASSGLDVQDQLSRIVQYMVKLGETCPVMAAQGAAVESLVAQLM